MHVARKQTLKYQTPTMSPCSPYLRFGIPGTVRVENGSPRHNMLRIATPEITLRLEPPRVFTHRSDVGELSGPKTDVGFGRSSPRVDVFGSHMVTEEVHS